MAAPSPTARGTPAGIKLSDGYQTLITFARFPTIAFWEKHVQPPGVDGGDKVEQTTMHNTAWRTFRPRHLITLTDSKVRVAYDPSALNNIISMINADDTITCRFPDGSTLAFYGYLKSFEPQECKEGEQPEADVMIVPTNYDATNNVEAAPFLTSVTGT